MRLRNAVGVVKVDDRTVAHLQLATMQNTMSALD
jgi:hypothetical protein